METELLDLELENRILNGTFDDAFDPHGVQDDTSVPVDPAHAGSSSIGPELAPQESFPVASAKPPPMRNPARERRKRELGFLREYAIELEAELNALRTPKRSRDGDSSTTVTNSGPSPWQGNVEAERTKRMRSEHENERLRCSLETQLRVAHELSLYLRQQQDANTTSTISTAMAHEAPTHIPPRLVATSFNLVVTQLLRDIDRAYAVTSDVFASQHWPSLPDARVFETTVKTRSFQGADQLYIELMDTAYRAHAYDKACDAAWAATRLVYASKARVIAQGPSTDTVLAVRYRTSGQTRKGTRKDLLVTCVAKRFRERDRTVIVWRTCDSPALHDSDMPVQAVSDETGWMVLTKVPDVEAVSSRVAGAAPSQVQAQEHRAAGTAFFQACSRLVPVWLEGDVADSSVRTQLAIGEFTNVVLSATEADVTGFETAFQKLVLQEEEEEEEEEEKEEGEVETGHAGMELDMPPPDPDRDMDPQPCDAHEPLVAFV